MILNVSEKKVVIVVVVLLSLKFSDQECHKKSYMLN